MKSSKGTKPVSKKEAIETLPTVLEDYINDLKNIASQYFCKGPGIFDLTPEHKEKLPYYSQISLAFIQDDLLMCIFSGKKQSFVSATIHFEIKVSVIKETNYFLTKEESEKE